MATQYTAGLVQGQKNTAAIMNSIGAAWETFTPTWTGSTTNPVLNNGTMSGKWAQINKTAFVQVRINMGSTTTYGTGRYDVSVPSGLNITGTAYETVLGSAYFYDSSATAAVVGLTVRGPTNTVFTFRVAGSAFGDVSNTAPFTWANGDVLSFTAIYEVA